MKIIVKRTLFDDAATIGEMYIDGTFECYTLEDKVRPPSERKVPGETAIPFGTYPVTIDFSQHFRDYMPHILGVPGFLGIRIHPGNTPHDTEGCILVGESNEPDELRESRKAFDAFFGKLKAALGFLDAHPGNTNANAATGEACMIEIIDARSEKSVPEAEEAEPVASA